MNEDVAKRFAGDDLAKGLERGLNPPGMKELQEKIASLSLGLRPLTETYRFPEIPRLPTAEEVNAYGSAETLVTRLHARYEAWVKRLPEDTQPVILALLPSGLGLRVSKMEAESHNGVSLVGTLSGDPGTECVLLVHQNSLQLLCYIEKVEEPAVKRPIGFHAGGRELTPQEEV